MCMAWEMETRRKGIFKGCADAAEVLRAGASFSELLDCRGAVAVLRR
jgi:hypothetical protein